MNDFSRLNAAELLAVFSGALAELRHRDVIRSGNNIVGDYAEYLVVRALGLELVPKSTAGHDAVSPVDRTRFQVKGRRVTGPSRQLGAIRDLHDKQFDYLAGVLFNVDYTVLRACVVPFDVVRQVAKYRVHVNAWVMHLPSSLWQREGVQDITMKVQEAASR